MKFLEELEQKKADLQRKFEIAEKNFKPRLVKRVVNYLEEFSGMEMVREVQSDCQARLYKLRSAKINFKDNYFMIQLKGVQLVDGRSLHQEVNSGVIFMDEKCTMKKINPRDCFVYLDRKDKLKPNISLDCKEIAMPTELFSWVTKLGFARTTTETAGGWGDDIISDTLTGVNEGYLCGMDVGYESLTRITDLIDKLNQLVV